MTLGEETGGPRAAAGAEGATAPETLRHPDLRARSLWKEDRNTVSPTGKAGQRCAANLSGSRTEGAGAPLVWCTRPVLSGSPSNG